MSYQAVIMVCFMAWCPETNIASPVTFTTVKDCFEYIRKEKTRVPLILLDVIKAGCRGTEVADR